MEHYFPRLNPSDWIISGGFGNRNQGGALQGLGLELPRRRGVLRQLLPSVSSTFLLFVLSSLSFLFDSSLKEPEWKLSHQLVWVRSQLCHLVINHKQVC